MSNNSICRVKGLNPVSIGQDVIALQKVIALCVLLLLVIISFFSVKGVVKIIVSLIALFVTVAHYTVLLSLTKYVKIMMYPFVITESTSVGSVFYVDIGQLSLALLLVAWRAELRDLLKKALRWKRCECVERGN